MTDQTVATFQEALQPIFQSKGETEDACYKEHAVLALVPKSTDFYGDGDWKIALKYKRISGRSVSFERAQANKKPSRRKRFVVPREHEYALWGLSTEVVRASKNNPKALADAFKEAYDDAIMAVMLSAAKKILRDGSGSLGQISSGSTVSSTTITLANIEDAVNFEVEDTLTFSSAAGSGARTGTAEIASIDRSAGTLTFASALNGLITGVATGDYIQIDGDLGEGILGMDAWNPYTAPGATLFCGVDRTVDLTRMSGNRLDGTGRALEEAWIRLMTRTCREGGRPNFGGCNPVRWEELEISLGSQRQYVDVEVGTFGFVGLKLNSPKGPVAILQEMYMQPDLIRVWNNDKHELKTMGEFPDLIDDDGLKVQRVSDDDAMEGRVGYWGNYAQTNPVDFGVSQVSTS